MHVCAVSRRVLNRMRQKLSAHVWLSSAAVARYSKTVDHVTEFIGRFERHLTAALRTNWWLTFPNTLLNRSSASGAAERRSIGRIISDSTERARTLELANLLEIDEVQIVYGWTPRFWTRSDICTPFAFHTPGS